ncbi:NAD(P)-dependent oxidoreductase [Allobranchiibius sp. GilTou38]|uniref:NAD-dependent epimerase/dehydratase family protein n=1 Tax=Allobranchiibius sp. GilTou38 TaxID=2815210 RepID=UPI001AA0F424|nr:NAD(P)-dependent oxidoreductase [Allobranchiibius sp. GilTou38]MBO1765232.1 NAD(P)-dependent oxidoreductase [Allobranchiibius sp. GilTou38]
MRALISGGAGFIGRHLATELRLQGHDLTALDLLSPQVHREPEAARAGFPGRMVVGDVCDADAWARCGDADVVIHLAAETGTGQSMYQQDRYHQVNVEGTRLAAREAARRGVPLVTISSRAVYGEGARVEADGTRTYDGVVRPGSRAADSREDDPHAPVSVYGETKSEGEQVIAAELGGRGSATVIRPQNVIGAGQALHNPYTGVLAAFLACLKESRAISVYGDGAQTRDFVHVTDLTAMIGWAVANPAPAVDGPRIVNCGSGVRTTLRELADHAVAASLSAPVDIVHVDVHRAGDIRDACADLTRARVLGAPSPRWCAADAVADFVRTSWDQPGARADAWDRALDELRDRGLTS